MIDVLFIALEFPPCQLPGAVRASRFVQHLPKHGIRPVVVCYHPMHFADMPGYGASVLGGARIEVPAPVFYVDASNVEPKRKSLSRRGAWSSADSPSPDRGEHDVNALFEAIGREFDIAAIWVTLPPFDAGRVGIAAKRYFKRPLIVDMRDAWSLWGSTPFRTWFHYRAVLRREREVLNNADAVVAVTPQLARMEQGLVNRSTAAFHHVPNAYDVELGKADSLCLQGGRSKYRVGYVGQFYFNAMHEGPDGVIPWFKKPPHRWMHYFATNQRWIYRSPYFFFRAWYMFRETYPALKDRFEFHYVGQVMDWMLEMARSFGLDKLCVWHGAKSKPDANLILQHCDMLLSTSIKVEGGEDYCLASKTFDYIALNKPVLGFVCAGSQRDFLKSANVAVLCDPDQPADACEKLRVLIERGFQSRIDTQYLQQFSAEHTSKSLADLILDLSPAETGRRFPSVEIESALE